MPREIIFLCFPSVMAGQCALRKYYDLVSQLFLGAFFLFFMTCTVHHVHIITQKKSDLTDVILC